MPTSRIRAFLIFLIFTAFISCSENKVKTPIADSTSTDSSAAEAPLDSTEFLFNPEDEYLGLGVKQFGDLDSMIERRVIRALVPYTYLYYYIDGKQRKGIAYEALNLFEKSLSKQLKFKPHHLRIIFIPVNRSQIIPLLNNGYADLAYAGFTITEERKKVVDFSMPSISGLNEIVVGGLTAPRLNSIADLSGKEIYLQAGSSYESAAKKLSDSLVKTGKPPIIIKNLDPYLETEDVLTMVHTGVIKYTAVVEEAARMWSKVLDSLVLYDQFPLASNVSYGMVFRKDSPKLKAATDKFLKQNAKGTYMGNVLYDKYVKDVKLKPGMYSKGTIAQVKSLQSTFKNYSDKYQMDWLLMVGQGYQESQLNQKTVSHAGAVGIMQVLPTTAAGNPINIKNINSVDNNVHAGIKFMRHIIDQYFNNPEIDKLNRELFALAAYNCGPARVTSMRNKAKAKGLNPNLWFDNVEIIAAREIGRETVEYVSNIYKFYASYRALDYYVSQRGKKLIQ